MRSGRLRRGRGWRRVCRVLDWELGVGVGQTDGGGPPPLRGRVGWGGVLGRYSTGNHLPSSGCAGAPGNVMCDSSVPERSLPRSLGECTILVRVAPMAARGVR